MVLVGMLNFVNTANVTSSIILLASQDTQTLSILALHYGTSRGGQIEEAGIISLIIMALTMVVSAAVPRPRAATRRAPRHQGWTTHRRREDQVAQ